jgi:hypothetical protein
MKKSLALFLALMFAAVILSGCTLGLPRTKPLKLGAAAAQPERTPKYSSAGWTIARGTIHNHTVFSDGVYEPEDVLELARRQGIAVLAFNDHREGKICIGKALCIQAGGVESHGYQQYWDRLAQVQKIASGEDMIVTRGVELSSPWFYNAAKWPNLTLTDQYRHFTVYGVQDPKIFNDMPARRSLPGWKPEVAPGDTPTEAVINYLTEHGAIVCAAHPDEVQDDWFGPSLHILTAPREHDVHLSNLTGFSIVPNGWHQRTGAPGGMWDTALAEYLIGMRPRPLWAFGDADFHGGKTIGSLTVGTTLFYMREFTEEEVYRCMREGRMVALQGQAFQDVYVSEWSVTDGGAAANPVMLGETAKVKAAPMIKFALNKDVTQVKTKLIRNGKLVRQVDGGRLEFTDEEQGKLREPASYRIEVDGPHPEGAELYGPIQDNLMFVNPIFARFVK